MSIALRNRLFGNRRPRSRTRPRRTFQSRLGRGIRIEPLEERALLAVAVAYVDDTWELTDDGFPVGAGVVSINDRVNNGNSGNGSISANYGQPADGETAAAFGIVSTSLPTLPTGFDAAYDEIDDAILATDAGGETRVYHRQGYTADWRIYHHRGQLDPE